METSKLSQLTTAIVVGLTMTLALVLVWNAHEVFAQGCDYQGNVLSDNPIAYWRLGETSGPTAFNIGSLGGAVDGTYQNGVTQGVAGLLVGDPDLAASFDGTFPYVSIPNDDGLNTGGPYSSKTVELWFRASAPLTPGVRQVLYEQGGAANGLNIFLDGNQLYAGAWADSAGGWTSTTVAPDTSYHVVLVFDGTTQTVTGYLDGVSFGPPQATGFSSLPTHSGGIAIGGVAVGSRFSNTDPFVGDGAYFDGVIDDVALYNQILSADRILAHSQGCFVSGPAIAVVKTGPEKASVGDTGTYSFTVTNIGDSQLQDLQVEDDVAGTGNYVSGDEGNGLLDVTESWVYSASYTIQPTDPDPLVNTVAVTGTDTTSTQVTDSNNHSTDLITASSCVYQANVLDDNPIAYWRLGEASGPTALNIGSLTGVNGTHQGGVIPGVAGLLTGDPDWAVRFNGSDGLVSIPGNAAINTSGPYSAKTIELWFRANDVAPRQVLYEQGGDGRGLNLYIEDNSLYLNGWNTPDDGPGSPWGPSFISTTISAVTTYHAVLVLEGDTALAGSITGYLNGTSLGSVAGVGLLYAHHRETGIGRENDQSHYHDGLSGTTDAFPFDGVIDEVALYDYALPVARIQLHASGCSGGPDLVLAKNDNGVNAIPGGVITYTLNYSNTGRMDAAGVTITDTVPSNATFNASASDAGWSCANDSPAGTPCTFDVGGLNVGSAGTLTFAVSVEDPLSAGVEQIENTASIADDGANGPDQNPDDNEDSDATPVDASPDLVLAKSDGGISAIPGGVVTYTLSYTNTGNQGATGVAITDSVPSNTTFNASYSDAGWSCADGSPAGTPCTFDVGGLNVGSTGTLTFAVTVDNSIPVGVSQLINTASIADDSTNGADQNPADNQSQVTTELHNVIRLFLPIILVNQSLSSSAPD